MHKAKLIRNDRIVLKGGLFIVEIKAFEVPKGKKYPEGVKLKCVLIDQEMGKPRILLDNHAPHGFHLHSRLPEEHDFREPLDVSDYEDAIKLFFKQVRKVISNEN